MAGSSSNKLNSRKSKKSTNMKKLAVKTVVAIAALVVAAASTSCGGGSGSSGGKGQITVKIENAYRFEFVMQESIGKVVVVDWGDGTRETLDFSEDNVIFSHKYSSPSAYTVTLTGENITHFHLWKNGFEVISLDVRKCTTLKSLDCSYAHRITSLDVSKCTALESLICSGNQLTSLDVSKNTALKFLYCPNNQLTSLDVSKCTALEYLTCSENQLTSLDLSNNTALEKVDLHSNKFTGAELNKLLETLHANEGKKPGNRGYKSITTHTHRITGSSNSSNYNRDIVKGKKWVFTH